MPTAAVSSGENDMSKRYSMTVALFGLGMFCGGNVAAALPAPEIACTPENEGEYAMTTEYSAAYVEYATYVCTSGAWELLDVSRCYYDNGRCKPL
jgi:hypothetical protein